MVELYPDVELKQFIRLSTSAAVGRELGSLFQQSLSNFQSSSDISTLWLIPVSDLYGLSGIAF
jgi:hypothetical protein